MACTGRSFGGTVSTVSVLAPVGLKYTVAGMHCCLGCAVGEGGVWCCQVVSPVHTCVREYDCSQLGLRGGVFFP